ncbi:hypothetical protein QOZ80_1AG0012000 [Eleusine coracana subsp. coracana]|nr:hypothetical protein QOZ80_1AG0012000 [Eleusine coracana subsp. coracana]
MYAAAIIAMEVLLLFVTLLLAGHGACFAASSVDGFSVELIHRDSALSPFHEPALAPHARMPAAARRSLSSDNNSGVVSEIVSRSFEYLMSVNIGTPPTRMLAIADTGSDLIWVTCRNDTGNDLVEDDDDDDGSSSSRTVFDQSRSSTYAVVGCDSEACRPLSEASCDAGSHCQYQYAYGDGSHTAGLLSTETFTFLDATRAPNVSFGCSTRSAGTFRADGLVGLGGGALSLVSQIGAATSLGRKFSYCLVPYYSTNASSALSFGARAVVSDPGAASTPLVQSDVAAYYTVELEAVAIGDQQTVVAAKSSSTRIIVDSGTTLTFLDPALLGPLVGELERRVNLTRTRSPEQLLDLCYDVHGREETGWGIPDVTLRFGGGAAVTLRPLNTFTLVQEGTLCLAIVTVSEAQPMSILGNVAQQDLHVGYDLDARTVTFAPADCANSSPPS